MIQVLSSIFNFVLSTAIVVVVATLLIGISYMWLKTYPKAIYNDIKNSLNK